MSIKRMIPKLHMRGGKRGAKEFAHAKEAMELYKKLAPGDRVWVDERPAGRGRRSGNTRRHGRVLDIHKHHVLIQLEHWKTCVDAGSLVAGNVRIGRAGK